MVLKGLRGILYFIISILLIMCGCWMIYHIENVAYLVTGNYPALGKYYISFSNTEENTVASEVYYKQMIYDEEIDLSNLTLYLGEGEEYCIEEKSIYNDNEIRIMLLENGLAELIDCDVASVNEINAQSNAIDKQRGGWDVNYSKKITMHTIFNNIFHFFDSHVGEILVWFLLIMPIGYGLLCVIKKIIAYRKIDTIFMGEISSGKTTIIRRLQNPNVTEARLVRDITTTKAREILKGARIPCGNKDIYPQLYDNSGNEVGEMLDGLKRFRFSSGEKRVVIYVLSITKDDKWREDDYDYINREIIRAAMLIRILKTSKSIKMANKIIVFFNKCDLIYESEEEFLKDKELAKIKSIYKNSDDLNAIYNYADDILYGSAIKGWGISELMEKVKDLY